MLRPLTPTPRHTAQVVDLRPILHRRMVIDHRMEIARATLIKLMSTSTVLQFEQAMKRAELVIHDGGSIEAAITAGLNTPGAA